MKIEITIGIAPIGSITANSTMNALKKSRKLNVDSIRVKNLNIYKQLRRKSSAIVQNAQKMQQIPPQNDARR